MKNNITNALSIVVVVMLNTCGCSKLEFQDRFVQSQPRTWNTIRDTLYPFYDYEFKCESKAFRTSSFRTSAWGLFGIPFIPFFPYWVNADAIYPLSHSDKFIFQGEAIFSNPQLIDDSISVIIKVNSENSYIYPLETQRNRWMNNIQFTCTFKLDIDTVDHLQITFANTDCRVAPIIYKRKSISYYIPMSLPID